MQLQKNFRIGMSVATYIFIYDKPDRSRVGVFLVGVHVMSRCNGRGLFSKEEIGLLAMDRLQTTLPQNMTLSH